MKKFIGVFLVVLLAMPVGSALAAVGATSHDLGSNAAVAAAGVCSPCHIPHGGGDRLFPDPGVAALGAGAVGQLCSTCHYSTGAYATDIANIGDADTTVYGSNSHGLVNHMTIAQHPDADLTFLGNSGLPYTAAPYTTLECTSCHNVHDDATFRPFLRGDIEGVCSMCHPNRHFDGTNGWVDNTSGIFGAQVAQWSGAAPTDDAAFTRGANPGSHPIGDDVTAAMNQTYAQVSLATADFNVGLETAAPATGIGTWELGGHLTRDSGVGCVSCHSVHGADEETLGGAHAGAIAWPAGAASHAPYENFLTILQDSTAVTYSAGPSGRTVASGYGELLGGGYNALCEGCHNTALGAPYVITDHAVDPGNTGFTHPLDGITPTNVDWAVNWASGVLPATMDFAWPVAGAAMGGGANDLAICESCHVAHPEANDTTNADRDDVNAGAAAFILRDTEALVCGNCHLAGGNDAHHPVGIVYNSVGVGGAAPITLANVTGAANDVLACATCHSGEGAGAHNWTGTNTIGLDAGWVPLDNARDTLNDLQTVEALANSLGDTCMACHFGASGTNSPGLDDGNGTGEAEYDLHGYGSHYLGDTGLIGAALDAQLFDTTYTPANIPHGGTFYADLTGVTWAGVPGANATNPGWSRWRTDTTSGLAVTCESCHELEPDKNNSGATNPAPHLLLAEFIEGQDGNESLAGDTDGRDNFCEFCHMPAGTHPMTGDVPDRTGTTLDIVVQDWLMVPPTNDANGVKPAVTWAVASDSMSCDSCHQVHDANSASGNFILEAPDNTVSMTPTDTPAAPNNLNPADGTDTWSDYYADGQKGVAHQAFCQYCHNY